MVYMSIIVYVSLIPRSSHLRWSERSSSASSLCSSPSYEYGNIDLIKGRGRGEFTRL